MSAGRPFYAEDDHVAFIQAAVLQGGCCFGGWLHGPGLPAEGVQPRRLVCRPGGRGALFGDQLQACDAAPLLLPLCACISLPAAASALQTSWHILSTAVHRRMADPGRIMMRQPVM